jgi:hypothetical protein
VATLRIVGGDEGEQSIELGDGVFQIGRARDNDIVLTGAEKGVSRLHAELRFENGRFVVVDLQSQNGTWVNGRRVERSAVPVGAEIAIGEYRLTIQGELPAARVAPPPRPVAAPVVARESVDDLRLRDQAPAAILPPVATRPSSAAGSKGLLTVAVIGVVVLVGMAAVWLARPATPATAAGSQEPPAAAPAPVPPAAAVSEPAPPERTNGAEVTPDPAVPAKRPAGASAAPAGAARVARKPGESAEAWRSRSAALQTRYGYSKAAMERGDFAAAAGGFEAILLEEPGFLDTAQLLVQAQSGLRSNARSLHQAGARLESSGDWVGALQKYEQARQIFSGISGLSDDLHRVREKLRIAGNNAFNQAKEHEAAGRIPDAVREYEKAVQWLPTDDPRRQLARTRVEQLKRD